MIARFMLLTVALLIGVRSADAQFNYVRNDQAICTPFGCHSKLSAWGTCVAVAHWRGGSVFLSAGHNFQPETPKHKIVRITIGGATATLRRAWCDDPAYPRVDFAVLYLPGRHADLIPLATTPPEPDDPVSVSGFVFDVASPPKVVHLHGRVSSVNRGEFGIVDFEFPEGTSGGPVVRRGELVGLALHRINERRHDRDVAGIQVNYDFRRSVLTLFPGATFAQAPPPPADDLKPPPPVDDAIGQPLPPPPKEIPEKVPEIQEPPAEKEKPAEKPATTIGDGQKDAPTETEGDLDGSTGDDDRSLVDRAIAVGKAAAPVIQAVAPESAVAGWLTAAGTAVGGPAGGAAIYGGCHLAYWLWNRRRKRKAGEKRPEVPDTDLDGSTGKGTNSDWSTGGELPKHGADVVPVMISPGRSEPLNPPVDDRASLLAADLARLVSRYEIQPNGKPEETFYRDAVQMVIDGHPDLDTLGGPEVGRQILTQVAKMHASARGDSLSGGA